MVDKAVTPKTKRSTAFVGGGKAREVNSNFQGYIDISDVTIQQPSIEPAIERGSPKAIRPYAFAMFVAFSLIAALGGAYKLIPAIAVVCAGCALLIYRSTKNDRAGQ